MKPENELTLGEIESFAKKNGFFKWIELTGGEPFLRDDLADIVRAFRDSSKDLYMVTMPTNSLCSIERIERMLRAILELGVPRIVITVSLDGYKELHDRLRGIPNNFEKAIAVFKLLKEVRKEHGNLDFVFGYTMSKHNKGAFERTFQEAKSAIPDITYNDFHINLAQSSENYYRNKGSDMGAYGEEVASELESILAHKRFSTNAVSFLDTLFLKKLVYFARTGRSPMHNRSLELSLFMDSGGNIYPSIVSNIKVGNIKDTDFDLMKILDGDLASRARASIRSGGEAPNWTSCEAYQAMLGNLLGSLL
jgi:MoaA/NifB/PqqE/SkfB family radical SAM enzyme